MNIRIISLAIILMSCGLVSTAQTTDKAIWLAHYNFTHKRDTTPGAQLYHEKFVLLLGKNASAYRSLDKQLAQDALAAEIASQVKASPNPHAVDLTIHGTPNTTADEYYQYPNDKKLYTEKKIINYYITSEPMPVINWKITSDTMSFAGQVCQKALAHVKGRDYIAWFSPDLPFKNGPWKLNGLPGLIVEAYDTKKEVIFEFAGFEDKSQSAETIQIDQSDIKATPEELEQLNQARMKDPTGFARSMQGTGSNQKRNGNSPLNSISPQDIKSINVVAASKTIPVNNPIELPEKK